MTSPLRRKGIRVALVAFVLACALPLAGCFATTDTSTKPTGEKVAANLQTYYDQVLAWKSCGNEMQCATAKAPLDWSAPSEATDIKLALVRHKATGTKVGSLFVNPGGPGASGVDFVENSLDYVSTNLQKSFDVVGWDPRGVGKSSAVSCYDGPQLDSFLFDSPTAAVDTPEYDSEVIGSAKDFAAACLKNTGPLLQFVDTVSTVHDLDMLRAIVGDKKLNYFGFSYGTDIGAHYADLYPKNVGRVVLDGATDPTVTGFQVNLAQTAAFGEALKAYLADCLTSATCPFAGETVDEALVTITDLLHRVDDSPIRGTDGRELNSAYLSTAIDAALYDQGSWDYLSQAFTEVLQGKTETTFALADYYVDRNEDGTYNTNFFQAFFAINCLDYPVDTDPTDLATQRQALADADPLLGLEDYDDLGDVVCENWPFPSRVSLAPVTGAGAAPILVVGTTGDPATPYQWAQSLASQLESGILLTYVGEGHIAYDEKDPCINDAVDQYFIKGTVPADGLTCTP